MAASQLMAASPRVSATCRWGLAAIILFGGGMVSACSSHREEPVSALPVSEFASAVRVIEFPTPVERSEEHTSELQSLMRISYAVFCLKKKKNKKQSR